MKSTWVKWEKSLVMLLIGIFFIPLPLTIIIRNVSPLSRPSWMNYAWLCNQTLNGVAIPSRSVPWSWPAFWSARYQRDLSDFFGLSFAGREFIIRATNELNYRLFHVVSAGGDRSVIGNEDWVFQERGLSLYTFSRPTREHIARLVQKLARLQEACQKGNIAFAVLLTPSKVSLYPEMIPKAWRQRYDPRPTAYSLCKEAFKEKKINYLDGVALTLAAKAIAPVPVFPKGGIHWSNDACLISTNKLLENLQRQNQKFQTVERECFTISQNPSGIDADLYMQMNLLFPWYYQVGNLKIRPFPKNKDSLRPNLVIIGDSFSRQVAQQISASEQCEEVVLYFYYNLRKVSYKAQTEVIVAEPVRKINMDREIFAADGLVYEANDLTIENTNFELFLDEALDYLAHSSKVTSSFLSSRWRNYCWGEKITFPSSGVLEKAFIFGFSSPEAGGIWTEGKEATMQFRVPSADCDIILEASLRGLSGPGTPQRATIFANNEFLGEWIFPTAETKKEKLRIPRALLDKGELSLQFKINHPISPQELGLSQDERKLGLCFSTLQLNRAEEKIDSSENAGSYLVYAWGHEISFRAKSANLLDQKYTTGFYENETKATWTKGNRAILRLTVPQSDRDLVLEAEVGGFFPDTRVDQQAIVYVNGQRLDHWSFTSVKPRRVELTIPHALIGSDRRMVLKFEILFPARPAANGLGKDQRELGLNFSSLKIQPLESTLR